ncbi:uncharacterized protein F5Z01DRAFT_637438 [Emericellopsis atlantica]|uniref:RING-type domain-containing protein n=1 Tax=Emericellopsis atlantica TaxID=2614577 RepID=A0A9P7ZK25_9HYPO|nr:uncharacterized protein F5Z01DRAFT_637438 [Emericellopsis atlantica]KAG9253177.1 hypothetical protein F5Z01DRAFT_637438 [Emericellopsis atlantica]
MEDTGARPQHEASPAPIKYLRSRRSRQHQPPVTSPTTRSTPQDQAAGGEMLRTRRYLSLRRATLHESFVPEPRCTFLSGPDRAPALICQICFEHRFDPANSTDAPNQDDSFVIMPCGHVACAPCMGVWQQHQQQQEEGPGAAAATCPFCRLVLRHGVCKHRLPARYLTRRGMLSAKLPRTIPDGGRIPDHCRECVDGVLLAEFGPRLRAVSAQLALARGRLRAVRTRAVETVDVLEQHRECLTREKEATRESLGAGGWCNTVR